MDPMKSRRWIAAAALAAAVVFLVMVTGERGPVVPEAAPVSSSGAVLSSDGGSPPANGEAKGDANGNGEANGEEADRAEIIDALQGLLDALGISPEELAEGEEGTEGAEGANCPNGNGNGGNGGAAQSGSDDADGAECGQSEATGGSASITITGFAFGQPVTVAPGATVEVVNTDAAPHNVTAADGSFETPDLNQDEKVTFTAPTTPGRHEFTCTLHPEMTGTLIVEGGEADSSTGDRGDDKGDDKERTRSTEPNGESKRSDTGSGGDHDKAGQHEKATPGRENGSSDGSSNGY
jgi:plastocyanin